ncbi:MAG TPA: NAD(P)H-dependent oxidoreductase [Caulobacteraceae bacterium]|nr:NAD(P)H-dependent oxidoreductase [Caulobacteraceae bacterium]
MTILQIDSSILGDGSVSRGLTAQAARRWAAATGGTIVHRDLGAAPIDHLTGAAAVASRTPDADRTPEQTALAAADEAVLAEFLAADVVIIGAPMYNFSISSQLKAWIDRIAVAGKTFRYTEAGPEGLAGGKKVILVSSRGGVYSEGPAAAMDHQESYLRTVLGFLGVTDIEIVRAEAVNFGPDQRAKAIADAEAVIQGALPLAA